ncbi:dihydrolipoyl dehydrogenase [Candidatus Amarolinea dominans]|uniref:dihydrolipoyl dehydrogenase n=1 Tax=Candidatus Amarolinea dominans TaxID=3140696 RepID=UPI00313704C2|nr:dihydrolipoyl dehydrogenase [Anaerolineae bacterium]
MSDVTYDVVVLGGGPGGYVAAIRASQLGQKTALIESEALGGVCLNWGCIPSKALLKNAEVVNTLQRGKEFGFAFENLTLDFTVAYQRSRQVSERLVKGIGSLMRKNKIDVFEGRGVLRSAGEIDVTLNKGGSEVVKAKHIILATGARARGLPGLELDGERIMGYRQAIVQQQAPKRALIVGAGPIGMEFAYVWRSYGAEVTVIEMLPQVLPLEDDEVSAEVAKAFKKMGVNVLTSTRTEGAERAGDGVTVRVKQVDSGAESSLEADLMLVATGVLPNSANIGLESVGVKVNRGGFVEVDEYLRTNVPGIYAIGDLTGKLALAHVASAQGIVAVEHIAGHETTPLSDEKYTDMPRCTYCNPQVASLGLTEKQARAKGLEIKVGKFPFIANGKALGLGEREGFVKIIADARYGEILGAHLVGPEVTELLPELVLAKTWELTPEEIARSVHAHPTLSEVIMEASHGVFGAAIHM